MEAESAETIETTSPSTQALSEGSSGKSRAKSKECPTCRKRLSSSYNKLLCGSCMNRVLEDQGPSFVRNMRSIIKKEIRAAMPSQSQPPLQVPSPTLPTIPIPAPNLPPPMAAPVVIPSVDLEEAGHSMSVSEPPSSIGDEEEQSLGTEAEDLGSSGVEGLEVATDPSPTVDILIKAVRETMGIEDTPESQTIQDRMFGALAPKKRLVFPIHQNIKTLIKHEWSNPDRKFFIPAAFKRKYPFDQEESSTWGVAPKIDPPVAKIFKQNALPFEDCASLKDPMDKRAEVYLKKDWEASTALFKPLVAATSVSRALEVWLSELKEMISKGTPAEELLKPFDTLEKAMSFVSEASADALKLSARSAAVSNSARRSLWLKEWKGDVTSRSKLCGVPCEGNLLFGPALDNILEKASDKKKGFPLIPQQANRPFKGKGRNTQRAPNTNKKEWRPTKKSKGFLFKNTDSSKKPTQ
ncbi:lamina-associated polypeptide 2-like [Dendropsophus ebraccatus]|uniref:lamina-associated polypeptide 2-like n=1 Tax=Dendropsophus ebraccatus TaxID=150705 RepID=UPI0038322840